ncbi:MAG TPA: metallophosphoesterase [Longimicrobiales bacterium]|nr:metallophosphoesterase [Longimicrobiales bacterium]
MSARRAAATVLLGGAALLGYAALLEPRWLQLRRSRIHLRRLPPDLEGLRIALLTDLHVGEYARASLVRRAVRMAMAERPHLVAVAGDLAADPGSLRETLTELSALSAPLGVFIVPGNHDYGDIGIEHWRAAVGEHPGLCDLTNRWTMRLVGAARLCVAGVDDYAEGSPRVALPPPDQRDLTVLLAHNPDQAERCRRRWDDIDLIVSGHTHAGQVRLPLLGALVSSAEHPELYEEGVRRRPWTQVYTSRGIGTTGLPFRFLARPEVALLELTGAPRPPLQLREEHGGVGAGRAPNSP